MSIFFRIVFTCLTENSGWIFSSLYVVASVKRDVLLSMDGSLCWLFSLRSLRCLIPQLFVEFR